MACDTTMADTDSRTNRRDWRPPCFTFPFLSFHFLSFPWRDLLWLCQPHHIVSLTVLHTSPHVTTCPASLLPFISVGWDWRSTAVVYIRRWWQQWHTRRRSASPYIYIYCCITSWYILRIYALRITILLVQVFVYEPVPNENKKKWVGRIIVQQYTSVRVTSTIGICRRSFTNNIPTKYSRETLGSRIMMMSCVFFCIFAFKVYWFRRPTNLIVPPPVTAVLYYCCSPNTPIIVLPSIVKCLVSLSTCSFYLTKSVVKQQYSSSSKKQHWAVCTCARVCVYVVCVAISSILDAGRSTPFGGVPYYFVFAKPSGGAIHTIEGRWDCQNQPQNSAVVVVLASWLGWLYTLPRPFFVWNDIIHHTPCFVRIYSVTRTSSIIYEATTAVPGNR